MLDMILVGIVSHNLLSYPYFFSRYYEFQNILNPRSSSPFVSRASGIRCFSLDTALLLAQLISSNPVNRK